MPGLNLGSTGLALGSGLIIQLTGGGTTITAPVLTLNTGPADPTPDFTIAFDSSAHEGDIVILQWATNVDFTSGVDETPTVLDAADIVAGEINETIGPLANGTWYFRSMIARGGSASDWSNVETETIDGGAASLNFSVASNSMYVPLLRFSIIGLLGAGMLAVTSFMGV